MSYQRSTIVRKKKKLACGCFDYAFSRNRCEAHAKVENAQRNFERHQAQDGEPADESFTNLRDDLDWIHSRMVRLLGSNEKGIGECFTCGAKAHFSLLQCGHFVPRAALATRWFLLNTRVQCKHCNEFLDGNTEVYEQKLNEEEIGLADRLREMAREICKPSREELKALIAETRIKVKMLEKLKKVS
jgi:hypothetical protein